MLQGYSGIPPAEGMLCDVPVLVFDHPHMKELFGDTLTYAENTENFTAWIKHFMKYGVPAYQNKQELLNGSLYMKTQQQLAQQYQAIFQSK